MKKYLAEAEQDPLNNTLYIADLRLSIAYFEKIEAEERIAKEAAKIAPVEVISGFYLTA